LLEALLVKSHNNTQNINIVNNFAIFETKQKKQESKWSTKSPSLRDFNPIQVWSVFKEIHYFGEQRECSLQEGRLVTEYKFTYLS